MTSKKLKISFVHPALMDYRIKLFEMISNEYDTTFIFTKQGLGQAKVKENHLRIPENWKYKILRTKLHIFGKDVGMIFKLLKEILIGDSDAVVVSTNWYICWPFAKVSGKKFIYWTEFWYWENTSIIRRILNNYTYYIARNSDSVIATGTKAYASLLDVGVKKEKLFTYPQCSANYELDKAIDLRTELALFNKIIILYVGRIVEFKGLPYLIKSLEIINSRIENVFLIVVGTGPLENYCRKLANDLGVQNILFTGFLTDESTKLNYYKTCDLFVLPSIKINGSYEPWGLVINEAMGFAKPIVTTDAVGSGYDLVRDGFNGYVVQNKDVIALSEAIINIVQDEKIMKQMGVNSKRIYDKTNIHENLFKVFKEAISYSQL